MFGMEGAIVEQSSNGDDWRDGRRFRHLGRRRRLSEHGPTDAWLVDYPDEIARHVEVLAIRSPSSCQRRLTIDVVLPRQGVRRSAWTLPITRLGKKNATSFIDLRDEAGRVVSLPTRTELGAMTCAALRPAIRRLARNKEERETLDAALATLVFSEPDHATLGLSIILSAFKRSNLAMSDRLEETLFQLVDNSIVWLRLVGRPGTRRVIKLAYDIKLEPPVVPARRPMVRQMRLVVYDLLVKAPEGRIDVLATLRHARARFTGRMGWDAIDIFLDGPVLQDPRSYHLEIAAQAGMQITELLLDNDVPEDPAQISDGNRHLYVRFPRPRASDQVRIKIRAERRGFLNASIGSSIALTALLWLFATHISQVGAEAALAPGAAVLVIAPALMAVFVSRPTESELVAAALTGVRTALGTCAVSSLYAAAALAGARPAALQPLLLGCASVATLASVSIGIAWLGTSHIVRKHCNRIRSRWCGLPEGRRSGALLLCTCACSVLGAWAALTFLNVFELQAHPYLDALLLLGVVLPGAGIWAPRRSGTVPTGVSVTCIAALLFALVLLIVALAHDWRQPLPFSNSLLVLVLAGGLATISFVTALGAELAPIDPGTAWAQERRQISMPPA